MTNKDIKNINDIKNKVKTEIDNLSEQLIELSDYLFEHPEIAGEEYEASEIIIEELKKHGFKVKKGISGITTSFMATFECGNKGPAVALLSEYDALPTLGHAVAHNLTSIASVGAAIALSKISKNLSGKIICIGTPGETSFDSKVLMIKDTIFKDIDYTLIVQAGDRHCVNPIYLAEEGLQFTFRGKASHAATAPHQGINALDAILMLFDSINALRQQLKEDVRIHGIILKGGEAVNIIPDHTVARFSIRSKKRKYLNEVIEKIKDCAKGAALQTGAAVKISYFEKSIDNLLGNEVLSNEYADNLTSLGETIDPDSKIFGSSDVGNISYLMPTISPIIQVAEKGTELYTKQMTNSANSQLGHNSLIIGAKTLAMTCIKIMSDNNFEKNVKEYFNKQLKQVEE